MKFLCFVSVVCSLSAQRLVDFGGGIVDNQYAADFSPITDFSYLLSNIKYTWEITAAANGDKSFTFYAKKCIYATVAFGPIPTVRNDVHFYLSVTPLAVPVCTPIAQSPPEVVGDIGPALTEYDSIAPNVPHSPPFYGPLPYAAKPHFTVVQPATPPDPKIIMLDGLGNSIFEFDLTTFAVTSQVVVPATSGPFGIRPTARGPENEVWVANRGLEISVVDLGAQQLLANILTPSIPRAVAPAGIVFTTSGATALEAVQYFAPDSSGNNGALLVFDAVNRKVTSTLLLKDRPTALLMAPDGLTAYLLDDRGTITYYDVLSGTADLSASTYTPGMSGGYPGASSHVFIHPDGTRLFWHVGVNLEVFDLTTRKVINQFSTGLPTTSGVSIQMSQDGSTVWFANALGNVVILDTRYGNISAAYQTGPGSQVFPGPAY